MYTMPMDELLQLRTVDNHLISPGLLASMAAHGQLVPLLIQHGVGIVEGVHRLGRGPLARVARHGGHH